MGESIYLHGSEDVQRAGNRMVEAGHEMQRAGQKIGYALEMEQRHRDDWLSRFASVIEHARIVEAETLWDRFAAQALIGILACGTAISPEAAAERAALTADSMLAERAKPRAVPS